MLIPAENEKDLAEIPDNVKRGMKIIPVRTVDEVLEHALTEALTPIAWEEETAEECGHSRQRRTEVGVGHALTFLASQPVGRKGNPVDRKGRGNAGELLINSVRDVDPIRTGL